MASGAELRERADVVGVEFDADIVVGVRLGDGTRIDASFVAIAGGAGSTLSASVGARRHRRMLQGVDIRAYAPSEHADDRFLEASI